MFKELLKAKRRYYGKTSFYPEALKITEATWKEIIDEGKALSMTSKQGLTTHSTNGMEIFFDNNQKEQFVFGFHFQGEFSEEPF